MRKHLGVGMILFVMLVTAGALMIGCASPTAAPAPTTAPVVAATIAATSVPATKPAVVATTAPAATSAPKVAGDVVRGGRLYDSWWEEIEAKAPTTDQPLWKAQAGSQVESGDTWRCSTCHGWDYLGKDGSDKTGYVGIVADKNKSVDDLVAIFKGKTNPGHDFSKGLKDQDLTDLALFIIQGQMDMSPMVNADKTAKGGDTTAGKGQFEKVCINCHGPQGSAINFGTYDDPEIISTDATESPYEFIHKERFGAPGWPMPSGIGNDWKTQDYVNVLAYAQTLPKSPTISFGGRIYDSYTTATGVPTTTIDSPLWKTQSTNKATGTATWRCRECHGYDYKGKDGIYASGSHKTGFPGILADASKSSDELTAWLSGKKNPDHDYSKIFDAAQMQALVGFIQKEMKDPSPYINSDLTSKGDPARGKVKFTATCAACHGNDGKKINFGTDQAPNYIGTVANNDPYQMFHRIANGQPGQPMPAAFGLGWTLEDISNVISFAQTLPTK